MLRSRCCRCCCCYFLRLTIIDIGNKYLCHFQTLCVVLLLQDLPHPFLCRHSFCCIRLLIELGILQTRKMYAYIPVLCLLKHQNIFMWHDRSFASILLLISCFEVTFFSSILCLFLFLFHFSFPSFQVNAKSLHTHIYTHTQFYQRERKYVFLQFFVIVIKKCGAEKKTDAYFKHQAIVRKRESEREKYRQSNKMA